MGSGQDQWFVPGGSAGRPMVEYSFYNGSRTVIRGLVRNPKICVYSRYVTLYGSVLTRTGHSTHGPRGSTGRSFILPGPRRVGRGLSRCMVNRSSTGGTLSITICGRCGHVCSTTSGSIRLRGDGVLLLNPANINGAVLTRALTGVLSIPFTVTSTAALARTKCINRSIRGVLLELVRTSSFSVRGTRHNVVCISRVSGVSHGSRGHSVAHSMDNRNIRRTLLGVLRNAISGIPPKNNEGRPRRRFVRVSAAGVLFVYNNTFSNVRGVVRGHVNSGSVNFNTGIRGRGFSRGRVLRGTIRRSLIGCNLVPRLVNEVPIVAILSGLSGSTLIQVVIRPGGSVVGRCAGLFRLSNIGLRFGGRTLRTITSVALRHGANTEKLEDILRNILRGLVFAIPDSDAIRGVVVARSSIGGNSRPVVLHGTGGASGVLGTSSLGGTWLGVGNKVFPTFFLTFCLFVLCGAGRSVE